MGIEEELHSSTSQLMVVVHNQGDLQYDFLDMNGKDENGDTIIRFETQDVVAQQPFEDSGNCVFSLGTFTGLYE